MDSMKAMTLGMACRSLPLRVFDWNEAARVIRDAGCQYVEAGIVEDWVNTCGVILEDGKPVNRSGTIYLVSTWGSPSFFGDDCSAECYRMEDESDGWGRDTWWPESAIQILNG